MKRPRTRNLLWGVLFPLSFLWAFVAFLRRRYYPRDRRYRSHLAILSVGNVHSGGSGKTPIVREICRHFRERSPVVLSRGYRGRSTRTGAIVDPEAVDGASRYGDEPWMLAQLVGCEVRVGRDRSRWVRALEAEGGARWVVLDDGFQHLALERALDLVVISSESHPGESYCLPWGDLREPLSALRSASALVLTHGRDPAYLADWREFLRSFCPRVPVFEATRRNSGLWEGNRPYEPSRSEKIGGFCGIASPERFRQELETVAEPVFLETFPDHHHYVARDLDKVVGLKKSSGATMLVTTDKDWFKVHGRLSELGHRTLSLRIAYDLPSQFWYFLERVVKKDRLEPR